MTTLGVATYYQNLLSYFDDPSVVSASAEFGHHTVSIETPQPGRLASFLQTMNHLIGEEPGQGKTLPTTRLLVVFREDADIPVARIPWQWDSPRLSEGSITCQYFGSSHSLLIWDEDTQVFVLVIATVTEQLLTRPEYMRVVLQGFLAELMLDSVHGGTLGNSDSGVLITNRGGSGKSSLVAAGVLQGFKTLGDDFLLVDSDVQALDNHELFSIFKTLKLSEKSPSWRSYAPHVLEKGEDKDLFFLDAMAPAAMTQHQKITAIVVPTVGTQFSFQALDVDSVVAALAPNSLGMGMHPARTLRALKNLAQDIPLYSMVVTPDVGLALTEIAHLVAS